VEWRLRQKCVLCRAGREALRLVTQRVRFTPCGAPFDALFSSRLAVARTLEVPFQCACGFTAGVASAFEAHLRRSGAGAAPGAHVAVEAAPPAQRLAAPRAQLALPAPAGRAGAAAAGASPRAQRAAARDAPQPPGARSAVERASPRPGRTPGSAGAGGSAARGRKRGASERDADASAALSSVLLSPEAALPAKRMAFMQDEAGPSARKQGKAARGGGGVASPAAPAPAASPRARRAPAASPPPARG
jgi:hypothetical protein